SAAEKRVCLELKGVRTARYPASDVSLLIQSGEILGLAGLVGAGRSELVQAIFGVDRPRGGSLILDGRPVTIDSPADAIERGIYLTPEDRRERGLLTAMTVRENITLPDLPKYTTWSWIHRSRETTAAKLLCERLKVKT